MRTAPAHVPRGRHRVVAAAIRQAVIPPGRTAAGDVWRQVADQLRPRWPKLGALRDAAEIAVRACMAFPAPHRTKLHSTNLLERLDKEVKRRAGVAGLLPNEEGIVRLIGAGLPEANDAWTATRGCCSVRRWATTRPRSGR